MQFVLFEKFTSADLSQIARESCDYLLIVHMYMQKFDSLFLFYVSPFVIVWGGRGGGGSPGEHGAEGVRETGEERAGSEREIQKGKLSLLLLLTSSQRNEPNNVS